VARGIRGAQPHYARGGRRPAAELRGDDVAADNDISGDAAREAGGPARGGAYADDDERAAEEYVAQREQMGAELVVVVRSLAARPAGVAAPWA
jgi:hypothetical protein